MDLQKQDIAFFQRIGLTLDEVRVVAKKIENSNGRDLTFRVCVLKRRYVLSATWRGRRWYWSRVVLHLSDDLVKLLGPHSTQPVNMVPPVNAEFLFYLFLDAKNCDALVGDLEERYKLIHKKFGARRANFWYWAQAILSVGPIVRAWVKKIAMKPVVAAITWAAAKQLLKDGSWLVTLVEFLKAKIRS
jgi:hypothetical protein